MNAITTFFKVFGIIVTFPVIVLFWPVAIFYFLFKNIIDSNSTMAILGSTVFIAILNVAWMFFLLQTAVSFGWISG